MLLSDAEINVKKLALRSNIFVNKN